MVDFRVALRWSGYQALSSGPEKTSSCGRHQNWLQLKMFSMAGACRQLAARGPRPTPHPPTRSSFLFVVPGPIWALSTGLGRNLGQMWAAPPHPPLRNPCLSMAHLPACTLYNVPCTPAAGMDPPRPICICSLIAPCRCRFLSLPVLVFPSVRQRSLSFNRESNAPALNYPSRFLLPAALDCPYPLPTRERGFSCHRTVV